MRRHIRSILITAGFVCLLMPCFFQAAADARTQMTLNVRTQLRPVNWPANAMLWFAPGPYWIDEWEKGVQSGTLDQPATLKIWNSTGAADFGRGFIRFERTGGVKEGTLARDTQWCVVSTAASSKMTLAFQGSTRVEFGYDGCVMKGTLAQAATLRTFDGKTNNYPKGTVVDFNGAGQVSRAVLPGGDAKGIDGVYQGNCTITGMGTFPFAVTARNGVFQGLVEQKLCHLRLEGNYNNQGTIANGIISGWIDVWDTAQNKNIRWTVRGPINGALSRVNPPGARGNVSATTSDGRMTRTGAWVAAWTAP